ncbi:MAG TPA: hypothetical protein VK817_04280 [Trebonia sp.]|jgi:hypothetical protein|nr:hypothetical protein [Trebonia sp.]
MSDTHRDINAIRAGSQTLLVTVTSRGTMIHLTREAGPREPRQGAVPEHYRGQAREFGYNLTEVADPRWAETTMCGRPWLLMAGGDANEDEATAAPSCRRCLALMDRLFPEPVLDERFPLVVQLVTDTITDHGYAEIRAVPGDHQSALRGQVRTAVRRRTGYGCRTYAHESMVIFVCEPIHAQREAESAGLASEGIGELLDGVPAGRVRRPWQLSWETWALGS